MRGKKLFEEMGNIREDFVQDTAESLYGVNLEQQESDHDENGELLFKRVVSQKKRRGASKGYRRRIYGMVAAAAVFALVVGGIGWNYIYTQEEKKLAFLGASSGSIQTLEEGEGMTGVAELYGNQNLDQKNTYKKSAEPEEYQVQSVSYPKPVAAMEDEGDELDSVYWANLTDFYSGVLQGTLVNEAGESVVCSPVNLYLCMAMLTEMTSGDTQKQILDALGQESVINVRKQSQKIWHNLYEDNDISRCILGNSLWLNEDIGFEQNVLEILAKNYYASTYQGEMGSENFDKTIQKWVNAMTGNALKEQADGIETQSDMAALLFSSAYFFDQWGTTFDEKETKKGTFYNADGSESICDFMKQTTIGSYIYDGKRFWAVGLSFEHGKTMYLFLPKDGVSVEEILQKDMKVILNIGTYMEEEQDGVEWAEVTVKLPKFEITTGEFNLIPVLKQMGIDVLFDKENADFTSFLVEAEQGNHQLWVNKVEQSTRIAIDEVGCSVASYTEVGMRDMGGIPEKHYTFTCNRPFLFVIGDELGATNEDSVGVPVFSGVVNDIK